MYGIARSGTLDPNFTSRDKTQKTKILLSLLPKVCTASSAGMLYSTYGIPNSPSGRNTKATFLSFIKENPETLLRFIDITLTIFTQSNGDNAAFCPIPVYIKSEAMKTKKLLEGHSRTIKSPPLEVDLCLAALSFRYTDSTAFEALLSSDATTLFCQGGLPEVDWLTPDDMLFRTGPSCGKRHACAVGSDIAKVVKKVALPKDHDSYVSLDVSGWDKNLPYPLMLSLFETFCGKGASAANFCRWLNRDSILVFNNACIKQATTSWCSGSRFTLSGNSLIHDSLLRVSGFAKPLLIQGDDAVVTIKGSNAGPLTAHYALVGLTLKQATVSNETFDFCKLVVRHNETEASIESTLNKAVTQGGVPLHSLLDIANCVDRVAEASPEADPRVARIINFVRAVKGGDVALVKAAATSLMPEMDDFVIDLVMPQETKEKHH